MGLPKPTPFKRKYYIRKNVPDLGRLNAIERNINVGNGTVSPQTKPIKVCICDNGGLLA